MTDYIVTESRIEGVSLFTGDTLTVALGAVLTAPEAAFAVSSSPSGEAWVADNLTLQIDGRISADMTAIWLLQGRNHLLEIGANGGVETTGGSPAITLSGVSDFLIDNAGVIDGGIEINGMAAGQLVNSGRIVAAEGALTKALRISTDEGGEVANTGLIDGDIMITVNAAGAQVPAMVLSNEGRIEGDIWCSYGVDAGFRIQTKIENQGTIVGGISVNELVNHGVITGRTYAVSTVNGGLIEGDAFLATWAGLGSTYIAQGRGYVTGWVQGGSGHDRINGGSRSDRLAGDLGNDRIAGERGNDTLVGQMGNDTLSGWIGADNLQGGEGNDRLLGGRGADQLSGGAGNDTYIGGTEADLFIFDRSVGRDRVTDFQHSIDSIDLRSFDIAEFGDLRLRQLDANSFRLDLRGQGGGIVLIDLASGQTLDAGDFLI